MAEKIIVRQYKSFETGFWVADPTKPNSDDFHPVLGLHEVTPYGMLLLSIASCTAQVVHSYAQHHDIPLEMVELREEYFRNFSDDCDNCENLNSYEEHINEQIAFSGNLDSDQRDKLFKIAHQCPIVKLLKASINIQSELVEAGIWTNGKAVLSTEENQT